MCIRDSIYTTPTTGGRKLSSSRSIPPTRVWKPKLHWVITDCLGLMEPARGESCPSGQRRGPAAPGEDSIPSPGQKYIHISTTPTRRRTRRSPGSIPPRRVWKPQPHWVIADWLGLMEPGAAKVAPRANAEVPPHPGRIIFHPRVRIPSISIQIQQPGDENADPPGRYRPPGCGNPNPTG